MARDGVVVAALCGLSFLLLGACGGDEASSCESFYRDLCERACECGGDDGCVVIFFTESGSLGYPDRASCEETLVDWSCGPDSLTPFDAETCEAALAGASCGSSGETNGLVTYEAPECFGHTSGPDPATATRGPRGW